MANFTVVYDANVLYPAPLRSLLIYLGKSGLFRARWTYQIHDEWIRNLLINRPDLMPEQLYAMRDLMIQAIPDSIITGHEVIIDGVQLPDPDDRHVLAAALRANAELIITTNLKDFPDSQLKPFNIAAQHPDDFILDLLDLNQKSVLDCLREDRNHYQKPVLTPEEYLQYLHRQKLEKTVSYLMPFVNQI